MITKKLFYGLLFMFIAIVLLIVITNNYEDKFVQGNDLVKKNNIIYTNEDEKYTGKVRESEGFKAKINDEQITEGFLLVKNGLINGKFEFTSLKEPWLGSEVSGKSKNGKIKSMKIKPKEDKLIVLKNEKEVEHFFLSKNLEPGDALISTFGISEED